MTAERIANPWYREPWPWIVMAGPALVVLAGAITTAIAFRTSDGLVADDYYKRGLAINQTLLRAQRAEQLTLGARVEPGVVGGQVRVTVTGGAALPPVLRLRLVHPTQAVADQWIELHAVVPGVYEGTRVAAAAGRRVMMLEDTERTWRLAGEATNSAQAVVLAPQ